MTMLDIASEDKNGEKKKGDHYHDIYREISAETYDAKGKESRKFADESKTKKEDNHDKHETGKGEVEIAKSKSESAESSGKKRKVTEADANNSKKAK